MVGCPVRGVDHEGRSGELWLGEVGCEGPDVGLEVAVLVGVCVSRFVAVWVVGGAVCVVVVSCHACPLLRVFGFFLCVLQW